MKQWRWDMGKLSWKEQNTYEMKILLDYKRTKVKVVATKTKNDDS